VKSIELGDNANDTSEPGLRVKPTTNEYDRTAGVVFGRGNVSASIPDGELISEGREDAHSDL
jgi:hypothetical protein